MAVTDFIVRFSNTGAGDERPGHFPPSKPSILIAENTINNTKLSLDLCGNSTLNSINILNNNLVHLLDNFCKNTAPRSPTEGQLWYDTSDLDTHHELGRLRVYLPQKLPDDSIANVFVDVAGTIIDTKGYLRYTGQIEGFYDSDYNAIPQDREDDKALAPETDIYYKYLTTKRHCDENYFSGFYMANSDKPDEDSFFPRSDRKIKFRVENDYFKPKNVKDYTALVPKKYVDDNYCYGVYNGVTDITDPAKPGTHTVFTVGNQLAKVNYTSTFVITLPKSLQDRLQVPTKGYIEDNFLYGTYNTSTPPALDYVFDVGKKINQIKYTQLTLTVPKDNTDLLTVPTKGYMEDNFLYGRYADSNKTFDVGDLITRINYKTSLTISLPKVTPSADQSDLKTVTDKKYVEDNFLYGLYTDSNATYTIGDLVKRVNYKTSLAISLPKVTQDLTTITDKKYVEDNFLYGVYTDSNATFTVGDLVTRLNYKTNLTITLPKIAQDLTTITDKKYVDDNFLYGVYNSSNTELIIGNLVEKAEYSKDLVIGAAHDGTNDKVIITKLFSEDNYLYGTYTGSTFNIGDTITQLLTPSGYSVSDSDTSALGTISYVHAADGVLDGKLNAVLEILEVSLAAAATQAKQEQAKVDTALISIGDIYKAGSVGVINGAEAYGFAMSTATVTSVNIVNETFTTTIVSLTLKAGSVPVTYWVTYGCHINGTVKAAGTEHYIDFTVSGGDTTRLYSTLNPVGTFKGAWVWTVNSVDVSIEIKYVCVNTAGTIKNTYITATPIVSPVVTTTPAPTPTNIDQHWDKVMLLVTAENMTDGGTNFTDFSSNHLPLTTVGTVTKCNTSIRKFGTGSIALGGVYPNWVNGSYISTTAPALMSNAAWTIEAWVNPTWLYNSGNGHDCIIIWGVELELWLMHGGSVGVTYNGNTWVGPSVEKIPLN